jgi:hypothetical protein
MRSTSSTPSVRLAITRVLVITIKVWPFAAAHARRGRQATRGYSLPSQGCPLSAHAGRGDEVVHHLETGSSPAQPTLAIRQLPTVAIDRFRMSLAHVKPTAPAAAMVYRRIVLLHPCVCLRPRHVGQGPASSWSILRRVCSGPSPCKEYNGLRPESPVRRLRGLRLVRRWRFSVAAAQESRPPPDPPLPSRRGAFCHRHHATTGVSPEAEQAKPSPIPSPSRHPLLLCMSG